MQGAGLQIFLKFSLTWMYLLSFKGKYLKRFSREQMCNMGMGTVLIGEDITLKYSLSFKKNQPSVMISSSSVTLISTFVIRQCLIDRQIILSRDIPQLHQHKQEYCFISFKNAVYPQ